VPELSSILDEFPDPARILAKPVVIEIWLTPDLEADSPPGTSQSARSIELSLISDLLKASGGNPTTSTTGQLTTGFPGATSAFTCARAILWALEGLAKTFGERRAFATIRIDLKSAAVEYKPNPPIAEQRSVGRIFVSEDICEGLRDLPGVTLRGIPEDGFCELDWQQEDLNRALGDSTDVIVDPVIPSGASGSRKKVSNDIGVPLLSRDALSSSQESSIQDTLIYSRKTPEGDDEKSKKKWIIIGVAAVILVLGILLGFSFLRPKKGGSIGTPTLVEQPPAAQSPPTAPVEGTLKQDQKAAQRLNSPSAANRSSRDQAAQGPIVKPPTPKSFSGSCDLSAGQISASLERAERNLHEGNLPEAETAYLLIINCPSVREKAQQGLRMTRDRLKEQFGTETPQ